jgi:hypothetical protein
MALDLDLGTMRWDSEGNWIEPDSFDAETLLDGCLEGSQRRPLVVPAGFIEEGDVAPSPPGSAQNAG